MSAAVPKKVNQIAMTFRIVGILALVGLLLSWLPAGAKTQSDGTTTGTAAHAGAKVGTGTTNPGSLDDLKLIEGDEVGNEVKSLKAELMVSHVEQKAVKQVLKLIAKHKGTLLEPELYFRLAELYMRISKTDRFFEIHRESETVVRVAPRMVSQASSKESVRKAVEAYSKIQTSFPDFAQMDLVLFNHAFARQALGEDKAAEGIYWELIKKYSDSPLVADSHLAIGEIAFEAGQYSVALEHFDAIRKYPESRVYPYGLYKAAWTHYNMRNAEKALKNLEEVVAYGKYVVKNKIDARLDLRKEALSDMTLFYEDVYPSKDAYKYFREQAGESEVGATLLRLGSLYERHSRFQDQQTVLDRFAAELPESELLPQVQTDLILANDHLRNKAGAVKRMEEFAQLCDPGSQWSRAQAKKLAAELAKNKKGKSGGKKVVSDDFEVKSDKDNDCLTKLNEIALKEAQKWLRTWKKLPGDTTYADASEKAFEIYLRTPSHDDEHNQSRFNFAEMLFDRGKYRQASEQYATASHEAPVKTKLSHDACYGALLSLEKAVGDKWSNEDEKAFHLLAQEYITRYPTGQYRLDIEYKVALLAYEKERYSEAEPILLRLGRDYANQEKGQKAQDLYLDILNIRKDYHAIRSYAQELLKMSAIGQPAGAAADSGARATRMKKLYEQAYFLEIQSFEEKGDNKRALQEYIAFSSQNPNSEFCEKAMWNAMLLYFKLGDALNGAKSAEGFATKYPSSPQAVNALLRAAQTFEQMAQLGEAARVLEKLAVQDVKSARRWKELAADFHALNGQTSAARKLYGELKAGATEAQAAVLLDKMLTFERNYGDETTTLEVEKVMVDRGIQPQSGDSKVAAVERSFDHNDSTTAFNEARRLLGSSSLTSNQKAKLRLVQAKILEAEFLKASVKSRAERIATVLAIKTEKLQKAQEAFQSAIKFGDPKVSLEAFEHLYGCYSSYVTALKDMPTPVGLSADDAKAFREEVDRLVIPLEEKSVDTLAQALAFARKQQFLDGSVARLEKQLNKLNQQQGVDLTLPLENPGIALPVLTTAGVGT